MSFRLLVSITSFETDLVFVRKLERARKEVGRVVVVRVGRRDEKRCRGRKGPSWKRRRDEEGCM